VSIDEIYERKRKLEARIDKLLTKFAADTGVSVSRLDIKRYRNRDACYQSEATEYVVTAEVVI
jgi:hypothetical protein